MRMSVLLSQTRRELPANAEVSSHILLLRAGFIEQLGSGIFALLPLGFRVNEKIKQILRQEMEAIGAQELMLPVVQPAELWRRTGRWYSIGEEMGRFCDRHQQDMVLAMTHEEACTAVVARLIQSYRQLPLLVYHIQTKWRDDPRPRAGLIRVREFEMKDSYSFDSDTAGLEQQYRAHYQAYFNIFRRCLLPVMAVRSDTGMMGGGMAHEFIFPTPIGEDLILSCPDCGYAANRQIARKRQPQVEAEPMLPLEPFATPACKSIEQLGTQHGVGAQRCAKMVFLRCRKFEPEAKENGTKGERLEFTVVAGIRGDMELNETSLSNLLGAEILRPATEAEIAATGAVAGYAAPLGLRGVVIAIDRLLSESPNLVAGANREGWHQRHLNYQRDYCADVVGDLAAVRAGDSCVNCGAALLERRGVEVGNIFQLGTKYSEALGCSFQAENGLTQTVQMGSYGIGVGRLLAAIAQEHHDQDGLIWPVSVAPYQVHLLMLDQQRDPAVAPQAQALYQGLQQAGIEVLFDDRRGQAGEKFKDADLLGLPLRLTVSRRSLAEGGIEMRRRCDGETSIVAPDQLIAQVQQQLQGLREKIAAQVTPVQFLA